MKLSLDSPTRGVRNGTAPFAVRAEAVAVEAGPTVVVAKTLDDLAGHQSAWEALAAAMKEPNPFYEPWMVLPALRNLEAGSDPFFVFVYGPDRGNSKGAPVLYGFFPLERVKRFKGLPGVAVRSWQHLYCFDCTPLVRPGCSVLAVRALLEWLANDRHGATLLELPQVMGGSPFHEGLVDLLHRRSSPESTLSAYTRAQWKPRVDGEAYLVEALVHKRRKEFKRLEKRLSDLGSLEISEVKRAEEVGPWTEEFLALEAKGWKGADGGAFASEEGHREFFTQLVANAFDRGRLLTSALRLDGRPVAMKCSFRAGTGSYAFKIAFDENFARFSPGVLLELDNIRRLHGKSGIGWMDSCAVPDHEMINRLWIDRRTVHHLLVPTGRRGSHLLMALISTMKWLKSTFWPPRSAKTEKPTRLAHDHRDDA